MSLNTAHEGYDYQDLLTSYFILIEILNESDSIFKIDRKEVQNDRLDDLTIKNSQGVFKKQIKYSNEAHSHRLSKADISTDAMYNLALDQLFETWIKHPEVDQLQMSLCLAWKKPNDELLEVLIEDNSTSIFRHEPTKNFKIDVDKFWPAESDPPSNWRRFSEHAKNHKREDFFEFCQKFRIETEYPKFSQDFYRPGDLEKIVLDQIRKLGISTYPNDNQTVEEFGLALTALIRRVRSKLDSIHSKEILDLLNVRTDYGSIDQKFSVVSSENLTLTKRIDQVYKQLRPKTVTALVGEPGSGKSWFVQNLLNRKKKHGVKVIHHLCYTDLDDSLQKERITLNVLYGNLISEVLDHFPSLKQDKQEMYASSQSELNLLLKKVDRPLLLVIDGLDHIDRVFSFRSYSDLSYSQIDIINSINKIEANDNVRILVASQPISKLDSIDNLIKVDIPKWGLRETKDLMKKFRLRDRKLGHSDTLSAILLEKSSGNPLYSKYLIEEVKRQHRVSAEFIENIPPYSFNLREYYNYLMAKLSLKEQVPRILSGANFNLSKNELIEITGEGKHVKESLDIISPVLKQNYATKGYSIYHESFRRYIIDDLKAKKVHLDKVIFQPIINWFESHGFFSFQKSYRYYLQFLNESGRHEKVVSFIKYDFVTKSVSNGYSWGAISKNYIYLKNSVLQIQDFPAIITLNQIGKTIVSTEKSLDWVYSEYLVALAHLKGHDHVLDYLSFEGQPTLGLKNGIEACYVCSKMGLKVPWDLYIDYFPIGSTVELEDFKFYIRYLLIRGDITKIDKVVKNLLVSEYDEYIEVFKTEFLEFDDEEQRDIYLSQLQSVHDLLNYDQIHLGHLEIDELANKILVFEHQNLLEDEVDVVEEFLSKIDRVENLELLNALADQFKGISWFNNWLVFCLEVRKLKIIEGPSDNQVIQAFCYLTYDLDPFKGTPKASGLYYLGDTIYRRINQGLELVKDSTWKDAINILVDMTNGTSVSYRKESWGPLSCDNLFKTLEKSCNESNIDLIIEAMEAQIEDKVGYQLHWNISSYYFTLSKILSLKSNFEKAQSCLNSGVKFALGYTHRKDSTLEEPLESVKSVSSVNTDFGISAIKKLKPLVDSVTNHTDGKGTNHFPSTWLKRYLDIDEENGLLYLLNNLKWTPYDWSLESCLEYFLENSKGSVSPIVEGLISRTYIVKSSEDFIESSLSNIELIVNHDKGLSQSLYEGLYSICLLKRNSKFSPRFKKALYKTAQYFELENLDFSRIRTESNQDYIDPIVHFEKQFPKRKEFSEMSLVEMRQYLHDHPLSGREVQSLIYYFDQFKESSSEIEGLITTLVITNERFHKETYEADLTQIFPPESPFFIHFCISRFVNQLGGWYEEFVNIDAFKSAYQISPDLAIESLIKDLSTKLNLEFSRLISGNLINAFTAIKYDNQVLLNMWKNLFESINHRLPQQDLINWNEELDNELMMNQEEVLISILFTRFKANTTERFQSTIGAIAYLLHKFPDKLIKPLKWFLKNHDRFLRSVVLLVIQLLREFSSKRPQYIDNFSHELEKIYPSKYYLIDALIELLLNKNSPKVIHQTPELEYLIEPKTTAFFFGINPRHRILENAGLPMENIFGKFHHTRDAHIGEKMNWYHDRGVKWTVRNLYPNDYILKLINEDLYQDLRKFEDSKKIVVKDLSLDLKSIVGQGQSFCLRPSDLKEPYYLDRMNTSRLNFNRNTEWIRMGHYEEQLIKDRSHEFTPIHVYGGIVFSSDQENHIPFFKFPLRPENLWESEFMHFDLSDNPVISNIQNADNLEYLKLLWLHPFLIDHLSITMDHFYNGISGKNEKSETVLKFQSWFSHYTGNGELAGISDEIPRLDGAQLLIRSDYYRKLTTLFEDNGKYIVYIN